MVPLGAGDRVGATRYRYSGGGEAGERVSRVAFDLVAKAPAANSLPTGAFRHVFPVKRVLGGLRLLFRAREDYDLVVLFATGERVLLLCRLCALLWMRPRRFFVFNEFSDGFWLHRDDAAQVRGHLARRYNWEGKRWRLLQWRNRALSVLRAGRWLALLPYRLILLLAAAVFFLPALLLIVLLRASYSTRVHRFRLFGRFAPAAHTGAPEAIELAQEAALQATAAVGLPAGHVPALAAAQRRRRRTSEQLYRLKAERLAITGACDGLAWTPGKIELNSENFVSFWVEGLPQAAELGDVRARLNDIDLEVEFLAPPRSATPRQVNARLPGEIAPGPYELVVWLGETQSPPFPLTIE